MSSWEQKHEEFFSLTAVRVWFRRLECYQCSTVRAADARRVNAGPEGPSSVLKVSGVEPQTTYALALPLSL